MYVSRKSEYRYNALAGQLAAILGPLLFGVISSLTGDQRLAIGLLVLFLGSGAMLLSQVPSDKVIQQFSP